VCPHTLWANRSGSKTRRRGFARRRLKSRAICAESSFVRKTIAFIAAEVENDTPATIADLVVDAGRCEGAVLFHHDRRVMMFPAGRPPILARSRAKERATAELYLPPGSAN
ncbi:MAG: hypothetical protein QOD57_4975, partial [Actinomycetota bacterium]|nr:hypothetical protein [Actinomycetota bacterium]